MITVAIVITAVLAAALFLPLGRWIGRRERPRIEHQQLAQVIDFPRPEDRVRFVSRRSRRS